MRIILILIVVLFSSLCRAQDSEQLLYDAYLETEMHVWENYLDTSDWNNATIEERTLLLNYEYGYTAHVISIKQDDAKEVLSSFENHLEAHKAYMDSGVYYTYKTGLCSYKLALEKKQITKHIKGIYEYIQRAGEISPQDPFVLSMQGNVEFFNPLFGSKQKALRYYQQADSIYHLMQHNYPRWNIRALQITLVQSLGKTGQKAAAIDKCHEILEEEPNFPFIRDVYLPSLLKK